MCKWRRTMPDWKARESVPKASYTYWELRFHRQRLSFPFFVRLKTWVGWTKIRQFFSFRIVREINYLSSRDFSELLAQGTSKMDGGTTACARLSSSNFSAATREVSFSNLYFSDLSAVIQGSSLSKTTYCTLMLVDRIRNQSTIWPRRSYSVWARLAKSPYHSSRAPSLWQQNVPINDTVSACFPETHPRLNGLIAHQGLNTTGRLLCWCVVLFSEGSKSVLSF